VFSTSITRRVLSPFLAAETCRTSGFAAQGGVEIVCPWKQPLQRIASTIIAAGPLLRV
jgi:hypothetical protein